MTEKRAAMMMMLLMALRGGSSYERSPSHLDLVRIRPTLFPLCKAVETCLMSLFNPPRPSHSRSSAVLAPMARACALPRVVDALMLHRLGTSLRSGRVSRRGSPKLNEGGGGAIDLSSFFGRLRP
ncbi:hypothetical protein V8E36_004737 [Tilletia maclaganii]